MTDYKDRKVGDQILLWTHDVARFTKCQHLWLRAANGTPLTASPIADHIRDAYVKAARTMLHAPTIENGSRRAKAGLILDWTNYAFDRKAKGQSTLRIEQEEKAWMMAHRMIEQNLLEAEQVIVADIPYGLMFGGHDQLWGQLQSVTIHRRYDHETDRQQLVMMITQFVDQCQALDRTSIMNSAYYMIAWSAASWLLRSIRSMNMQNVEYRFIRHSTPSELLVMPRKVLDYAAMRATVGQLVAVSESIRRRTFVHNFGPHCKQCEALTVCRPLGVPIPHELEIKETAGQ